MIVALAALCFANSLCLVGHPLFDIYEGICESWRRGGARGPNEQAPRGQGIWPCGPCPFGPLALPRVPPVLRLLLHMKNWRSIFPRFYFLQSETRLCLKQRQILQFYSSMG
jgi:hypothetical protein